MASRNRGDSGNSNLDRLLLHVGDVDEAWPNHTDIVHQDSDLLVQRLDLLDSLGHAVGVGEVGHHGEGVDPVFVPDLIGRVLQLLLVLAHQDDVEAGLGQSQGVLLPNTLNSYKWSVLGKLSDANLQKSLVTCLVCVLQALLRHVVQV